MKKDFQIVYRKGGKNIKQWLANTNINTIDSSNIVLYGCYDCGRNCINCKYLKEKSENIFVVLSLRDDIKSGKM